MVILKIIPRAAIIGNQGGDGPPLISRKKLVVCRFLRFLVGRFVKSEKLVGFRFVKSEKLVGL